MKLRSFDTVKEMQKYSYFLNLEKDQINKKKEIISEDLNKLYNLKKTNPDHILSKRCCDFKLLEKKHNQR